MWNGSQLGGRKAQQLWRHSKRMSTHATHTHNFLRSAQKRKGALKKKVLQGLLVRSVIIKKHPLPMKGMMMLLCKEKNLPKGSRWAIDCPYFKYKVYIWKVCGECIPLFFFQLDETKSIFTSCARRLFASVIATFENRITERPKMFWTSKENFWHQKDISPWEGHSILSPVWNTSTQNQRN